MNRKIEILINQHHRPYISLRWLVLLFLFVFFYQDAFAAEQSFKPPLTQILPDRRRDNQSYKYLIELAPYFESEKNDADSCALGVFISADITDKIEIQFASDTVTYQDPDLGVSDISFGFRWDFFDKYVNLALIGYLELPTGSAEFAEANAEPTLWLEASKGFGNFTASLTLGSTYLADSEDEDYYFNYSIQAELDYSPDESNEIGAQFSGYMPDQLEDGMARVLAGVSYTRNLNPQNSVGISVLKGLSSRGMDWILALTYDYQF
jgi:hypothetical protein